MVKIGADTDDARYLTTHKIFILIGTISHFVCETFFGSTRLFAFEHNDIESKYNSNNTKSTNNTGNDVDSGQFLCGSYRVSTPKHFIYESVTKKKIKKYKKRKQNKVRSKKEKINKPMNKKERKENLNKYIYNEENGQKRTIYNGYPSHECYSSGTVCAMLLSV